MIYKYEINTQASLPLKKIPVNNNKRNSKQMNIDRAREIEAKNENKIARWKHRA